MNAKALCTASTAATPGSAAGSGGCLCGNDLVAVAQGEFCGIKADNNGLKMPTATCPSANNKNNGQAAAGAACNCGTEALVPVTATQYCEVKTGVTTGRMNAKALCTASTAATPGSAAGSGGCLCGNDLVAVAQGEFCGIKADNNGLKMRTPN